MKDSSNKRMKAGNLNASLEAINLLVGAHELYHNIPYNHEVQVGLRILEIKQVVTTYTLIESVDNIIINTINTIKSFNILC